MPVTMDEIGVAVEPDQPGPDTEQRASVVGPDEAAFEAALRRHLQRQRRVWAD